MLNNQPTKNKFGCQNLKSKCSSVWIIVQLSSAEWSEVLKEMINGFLNSQVRWYSESKDLGDSVVIRDIK